MMTTDMLQASEIEQISNLVDLIQEGCSPLYAAIQVGWTPRDYYRRLADKDFAEMIEASQSVFDARIETKLAEVAEGGNMTAITTYLFNRMPHKWSDRKRIDVATGNVVNVTIVQHTTQAIAEMMAKDPAGIARALGPGGILDDDIVDAEVLDG